MLGLDYKLCYDDIKLRKCNLLKGGDIGIFMMHFWHQCLA